MPLTPEDVSNKRFTPVRLREGYDMGEVDQFLDEVESELERLLKENDDLRSKLAAAHGDGAAPAREARGEGPPRRPRRRRPEKPAEAEAPAAPRRGDQGDHRRRGVLGRDPPARAGHPQRRRGRRRGPRGRREDPRRGPHRGREAGVGDQGAHRQARAGRPHAAPRTSTPRPRTSVASCSASMEKEKGRLDSEIENLRAFEREYRSRLKSYFTQQLAGPRRQRRGRRPAHSATTSPRTVRRTASTPADQHQGS